MVEETRFGIRVEAGEVERKNTLLTCALGWSPGLVHLTNSASGDVVVGQVDGGGRLHMVVPRIAREQSVLYRVSRGAGGVGGVSVVRTGEATARVTIDGQLLTEYRSGPEEPGPHLCPLIASDGTVLAGLREAAGAGRAKGSRKKAAAKGTGTESKEAVPVPSCWVGVQELNKVSYWWGGSTPGRQQHVRFEAVDGGPLCGRLRAAIEWLDPAGKRQLTETRTYTFYRVPGSVRLLDLEILLRMTDGKVVIKGSKEGGLCAVRVSDSIAAGAVIRNAAGRSGEKACSGERADWCDFSGPVNGNTFGVAVFDHPGNPNAPAFWDVRSDGLLAANPFCFLDATGRRKKRGGSLTVEARETLRFRYRICIHPGDGAQSWIADLYRDFATPPAVRIL